MALNPLSIRPKQPCSAIHLAPVFSIFPVFYVPLVYTRQIPQFHSPQIPHCIAILWLISPTRQTRQGMQKPNPIVKLKLPYGIPSCYPFLLSLHIVHSCHPFLLALHAIHSCYHFLLSLHAIHSCYHFLLSLLVYPPYYSFLFVSPTRHARQGMQKPKINVKLK